jgi:hypothetical protein
MDRIWMVAAAPLLLMAVMCAASIVPSRGDTYSIAWLALLSSSLATGLCMLVVVFMGWWRGVYRLNHAGIIATLVFASLDVLIPTTLLVLLLLLLHKLKDANLLSF